MNQSIKNFNEASLKLSIIIPTLNEEKTLPALLEKLGELPYNTEIIIVDDGSADGTRNFLNAITRPNIKTFFHSHNQGKGAAIRTAQPHVTGNLVIIQDADMEYQPEDFPDLLAPILSGQGDVVYGSRFLGTHRAYYFWNFVANKILNILANILYNTTLTDFECGYKVFRTEIFKNITITADRFDLEPELTAKILKQNLRLVEVPITYYGRTYAEGKKITWKDFFPAVWTLIKFRFID